MKKPTKLAKNTKHLIEMLGSPTEVAAVLGVRPGLVWQWKNSEISKDWRIVILIMALRSDIDAYDVLEIPRCMVVDWDTYEKIECKLVTYTRHYKDPNQASRKLKKQDDEQIAA